MNNLNEILPFLIPLIIIEFILLIVTLRHILTHTNYKYGNRTIWLLVTIIGMNLIGPVLYFLFGKEET
ncbi:MAG: PLDc N-terminal domain-containing protein [Lachnospiraceae bacterium]|nr:PLDc N-terminal domain-containing protein [Lachnospiraceae bacterium]